MRLKGWQVQEAGDLETQPLAGHDGFADMDPLAPKHVHAGVVHPRHTDAAEGVALGALDISRSRARYYLISVCAPHPVIDLELAAACTWCAIHHHAWISGCRPMMDRLPEGCQIGGQALEGFARDLHLAYDMLQQIDSAQ